LRFSCTRRFAVTADQTVGASSYNPLSLPLIELSAGEALPAATDAIVPIEHGEPDGNGNVALVEAWAAGSNVDRLGAVVDAGKILMSAGTVVGRRHIGILAAAGFARLPVVRCPRVEVVLVGAPRAGALDSNGPMLSALIERDGGMVLEHVTIDRSRAALAAALGAGGSDMVVVVGGTGPGRDDGSAAALAAAGELAIHGIALRPGETAGLGRAAAGVPVILLPGSPAACLCCYEMLAGARSGVLAAAIRACPTDRA
jgi:molybdopterin molybdotransferase